MSSAYDDVRDATAEAEASGTPSHLATGRLGVGSIVFFVIAAVAPLGAITGGAPVIFASVGVTAPLMYVLVGVLFAIFSVGFVAMSRHLSNAGGFVAYIAKGLGVRAGTALAAVTVLGYLALVCGFWGFFGGITQLTMAGLGINLPGPVWVLIGLVVVTFLCYRGANVSLWALGILLVLEISALVITAIGVFVHGGAAGINLDAFTPSNIFWPGAGIAFLFAVTCFTGFEATVVFSEEAKQPRRTIPRAAYTAIAIIGIFYAFVVWALAIGWGSPDVQAAAEKNPASFVFAIAAKYVGPWLATIMGVLLLTSLIAMFLGFHNIVARYLFALGRAHVLPPVLGKTSATGTPRVATLVFSSAVVVVVGVFLMFGADLITVVYSWLTALGTVCILTVLIATAISIVVFFARSEERSIWKMTVAPTVAALGFVTVGILAITNYSTLLGGTGEQARWLLVLIPVLAVVGWWWASRSAARGRPVKFDNSLL